MTPEAPKPNPDLITGVPTPEQLENERSHVEETLSVDALKAVIEGRDEGKHASELNADHPATRTTEVGQPAYPEAQPTGPLEVPEAEQTITPERLAEVRKQAGL